MKKYNKTSDISKTFCILPWIHFCTETNGEVKLCCSANGTSKESNNQNDFKDDNGNNFNLNTNSINNIWNSDAYKNVRIKMLNGEKPFPCGRCYEQEEQGLRSKRSWENEYWFEKIDVESILKNTKPDGYANDTLYYLDLKYGNKCNLKCIMCNPYSSSLWIPDWKKMETQIKGTSLEKYLDWDKNEGSYNWFKIDNYLDQLYSKLDNIQEIYFTGGEPSINKDFHKLLSRCIENGISKNITIRFNTNGVEFSDEFINLIKDFKHVRITLSVDGLFEQNEYIRYPIKWKIFENTLEKLNELNYSNIIIVYDYTISALNVDSFPDFLKWKIGSKYKNINSYPNFGGLSGYHFLYHPKFLSCKILPFEFKKTITQKYEDLENWIYNNYRNDDAFKNVSTGISKIMNIPKFMNADDLNDLFPEFVQYLNTMDKIRNTNFLNNFQSFRKYING